MMPHRRRTRKALAAAALALALSAVALVYAQNPRASAAAPPQPTPPRPASPTQQDVQPAPFVGLSLPLGATAIFLGIVACHTLRGARRNHLGASPTPSRPDHAM